MKILVWNCKMGFSDKRRFVRRLCPGIAVIPECSQTSIQSPDGDQFDGCWFGEDPSRFDARLLCIRHWVSFSIRFLYSAISLNEVGLTPSRTHQLFL
jgi:hypothetical protein